MARKSYALTLRPTSIRVEQRDAHESLAERVTAISREQTIRPLSADWFKLLVLHHLSQYSTTPIYHAKLMKNLLRSRFQILPLDYKTVKDTREMLHKNHDPLH